MQDNLNSSNAPLTQVPSKRPALSPEEILVKQWPPDFGSEDLAMLECLLDEAVQHLGNILKLLPYTSHQADKARDFLTQFRQPV